jgi:hypothetical protein
MCWRVCVSSERRVSTDASLPVVPGAAPPVDEGSAIRLAAALAALGMGATVQGRERLAVIHLPAGVAARMVDEAARRQLIALGRSVGFSHVAVAVGEP